MGTFTVGQIVHYVAYNGTCLAAIVIGYNGEVADLAVFTNLENSAGRKNFGIQFHQDVVKGTNHQPGTYHCVVDCN
jgi:hypothetical protein